MRLFFYGPEGGTSADSSEAALEHTFGPLATVRPDLAAMEGKEREGQKKGKPPILAQELGRPMLDSERKANEIPAEPEPEKPKKTASSEAAREDAPPAEGDGETASGSDHESPDEDGAAALDALLAKYQGKPRSMAQALREIRSLQTKTAEEKKDIQDRLDAAAAVLDSDYEWSEGKPVLKTDVAARHLRAQRGEAANPLRMPSEAEIRAEVEGQFRKKALETIDEDQVPAFLASWKPLIDQTVTERTNAIKTQVATQRAGMQIAVGDMVGRHITAHPEHKDLLPEIDKFYSGIPEEARTIAFLENWVPLERIAELLHTERSVKQIAKDAYELGLKGRGKAVTPTDSGSPGRSRPTPTNGRDGSSDVVKAMKAGVMRGSGLPSLDELFAK